MFTQTFKEPETINIPIELVDTAKCTAGYDWCDRDCNERDGLEDDWDDDAYHRGTVAQLSMMRFTPNGWRDLNDVTLTVRHDENEGDDSRPLILIDYPVRDCTPAMTAEQARKNAAWLLNAADLLDPLPAGVVVTTAMKVRIGDELLTDDGWQKVIGLLLFADIEQASFYTPERHADTGDGWDFSFNDPVKVRRHLTGSCAIQFVEPIGGTR